MEEVKKSQKGGKARYKETTPEERKAHAMKMVEAKKEIKKMPKASHRGEIHIGDIEIPCAVLEDGRRVLSEFELNSTLGSLGGKNYKLREKQTQESDEGPLPFFISSKALKPFIRGAFEEKDLHPVQYMDGSKTQIGYSASILPKVCEVWLKAKDAGVLQESQFPKAKKAEILMRGLAHIGIIALVDEATGYQKDRARDALAKILEAYVEKELQPWIKTFDSDFYEQMFRLRDLPYPPEKMNYRPAYFGHLTNDIVYSRLAPGVLAALKEEAKKDEKKNVKLFQHLTAGYGRQELLKHLGMLVGLMKLSGDWEGFMLQLNKISARYNETMLLDIEDKDR